MSRFVVFVISSLLFCTLPIFLSAGGGTDIEIVEESIKPSESERSEEAKSEERGEVESSTNKGVESKQSTEVERKEEEGGSGAKEKSKQEEGKQAEGEQSAEGESEQLPKGEREQLPVGESAEKSDSLKGDLIELELVELTPSWGEAEKDTVGLQTIEESFEQFREMGLTDIEVMDYLLDVFYRELDILDEEMALDKIRHALRINHIELLREETREAQELTKEERRERLRELRDEERELNSQLSNKEREYRKNINQLEKDYNQSIRIVSKKYK